MTRTCTRAGTQPERDFFFVALVLGFCVLVTSSTAIVGVPTHVQFGLALASLVGVVKPPSLPPCAPGPPRALVCCTCACA